MSALRAEGVRVSYGEHAVLDGVDLQVSAGEVVALVGPNGAGKSTLLSVLGGDPRPDAGRVLLDDVDLRQHDLRRLARHRAVMLQETRLSFPFQVAEVVRMGRHPWRGTAREDVDDDLVEAAMADAEVVHLAARTVPTLSGGEKARTSFARTLAQDAPVLLLDEPTAALDVRHQEALLSRVRRAAQEGAGVVVVLHDLTLAAAWADRVVVLAGGRVRADGAPADVLTSDLLSAVYEHPIDVWHRPSRAPGGPPEIVVLPVRAPHGAAPAPSNEEFS